MKQLILILHSLAFSHLLSFGQQPIEVTYKADPKGNYEFSCDNRGYCNYIVEVTFTDLQNLRAGFNLPFVGTVSPGFNNLFTLTKENTSNSSNFRFSYRYIKGCVKPKIIMDYPYLLPVAPGKEIQSSELEYFLKRYRNDPTPPDWYSIAIKMNAGDTVYAARRGTVTEVKDNAILKDSSYLLASADNFIEVYHQDCSFARYQVLRDKGIFVKIGQLVEAGEPIGIVGGDKYVGGAHLRFCVYYAIDKDIFIDYEKADRRSHWAYVPLQFWIRDIGKIKLVNNSKYKSEHPPSVITQEMSKREIKKWTEKHKG